MHWASWQDFWAMGGSGPFVWGAYGVAALALLVAVLIFFSLKGWEIFLPF